MTPFVSVVIKAVFAVARMTRHLAAFGSPTALKALEDGQFEISSYSGYAERRLGYFETQES
jgi:hypothetical protein